HLRQREQIARLVQGIGYLTLLQGGVLRAEANDHTLPAVEMTRGMEALHVLVERQWFQISELEYLTPLAPNTRFKQLGQPLVLTTGSASTCKAGIGLIGARGFIQRFDAGERHSLNSERAGDAQLVLRHCGLVVEN